MEGNSIDPDFINTPVVTYVQMFVGDEIVPSTDITYTVPSGLASVDYATGKVTMNLSRLGNEKSIEIQGVLKGSSTSFSTY
jgi:hypothetical protein